MNESILLVVQWKDKAVGCVEMKAKFLIVRDGGTYVSEGRWLGRIRGDATWELKVRCDYS